MLGLNGTPHRHKRRRKSSKARKPKSVSEVKKGAQADSAESSDRKRPVPATADSKQPKASVPHKNGRPKEYFTPDLLAAWPGFIDEGVDLPALLPEFPLTGRNM